MNSLFWVLSDISMMIKRNLLRYIRLPQLLVFATIQPVMFLLLFRYVFGGAIQVPGGEYIAYLLPGIIIQTSLFGSTQTGLGLAEDLSKGIIDRFHSLPMARSAVLAGRTLTDSIRNAFVVLLMLAVGMAMGFRFQNGIWDALLAFILTLMFGFAFSWISASIGLMVKNPEAAQVAGFIWIFPLAFASSIFVPTQSMAGGLRVFAEHTPITYTVNAIRALTVGDPSSAPIAGALLWIAGIYLVFIPLAVYLYRRAS